MGDGAIIPVRMPKWGLSMMEGKIVSWSKTEGASVREGEDLVDIETSKITNICEAPAGGTLRRIVAQPDDSLPVGALIAVLADASVSDAEIDAFVAAFNAKFVVEAADADGAGLATRKVVAGGVALRVGMAGLGQSGAPAVLIHGFGGDMDNWTLTMGALAEGRPVYAIELPGHGQSEKRVPDATVAGLAGVVLAALAALDIGRVHLVGHSLGGAVALAATLAAPATVASLALVCSAGVPGSSVSRDYLDGFIDARRARDLQPVAEMLFADPALATKDLVETLARFKRIDGVEEALRAIRDAMVETDELARLGARIADVSAPLLVVATPADRVVSAPDATKLPATASMIWIDGAGHLPQIERPEETARALSAHMRRFSM